MNLIEEALSLAEEAKANGDDATAEEMLGYAERLFAQQQKTPEQRIASQEAARGGAPVDMSIPKLEEPLTATNVAGMTLAIPDAAATLGVNALGATVGGFGGAARYLGERLSGTPNQDALNAAEQVQQQLQFSKDPWNKGSEYLMKPFEVLGQVPEALGRGVGNFTQDVALATGAENPAEIGMLGYGLTQAAFAPMRSLGALTGKIANAPAGKGMLARDVVSPAQSLLTPEGTAIRDTMVSRGIEPLRAEVLQTDKAAWKALNEQLKSDNPVSSRHAEANKRLPEIIREQYKDVQAYETAPVNIALRNVPENIALSADSIISKAYDDAKRSANGSRIQILPDELINKSVNMLDGGDQVSSAAKDVNLALKSIGVDNFKNPKKLTIAEAETLRQDINRLIANAPSKQYRYAAKELKSELDNVVDRDAGGQYFADARQAVIDYHALVGKKPRNKFDTNDNDSVIEKIISNETDNTKIIDSIINSRSDDFNQVMDFYTNKSGESGKAAWNNLKGNYLNTALENSLSGKEVGNPIFNVDKFESQIKKLKNQGRYESMYDEAERAAINDVIKIGKARKSETRVGVGEGVSSAGVIENSIVGSIGRMLSRYAAGAEAVGRLKDFIGSTKSSAKIREQLDYNPMRPEVRKTTTENIAENVVPIGYLDAQAQAENERVKRIMEQRELLNKQSKRIEEGLGK